MAFLGSNQTASIDEALGGAARMDAGWAPEMFDADLFLADLAASFPRVTAGAEQHIAHPPFLHGILRTPVTDLETILLRQAVLAEMDQKPETLARVHGLFNELVGLLDEIKASYRYRDERAPQRLRVLARARALVERLEEDFRSCDSALARLAEAAETIRGTESYEVLTALLDWDESFASLRLDLTIGASGKIRRLRIDRLREHDENRFHVPPWRRWIELARLGWRGYDVSRGELVARVVIAVYREVLPVVTGLVQLIPQLEVYLVARELRERARARGLEMCLPEFVEDRSLHLEGLFNPLLLSQERAPVPCDLKVDPATPVILVTGPNSGGKTRLLQGIGLAQVLAQSGLYVPATRARMPLRSSGFASLIHYQSADQTEGRLGTELARIRLVFEQMDDRSLILLDELCSGTNPSEAAQIITRALELLVELSPIALITTHFLDLAAELEASAANRGLGFLQVQVDDGDEPTFQFVPGVARTSLAAGTARRLGLDFDRIAEALSRRT